MRKIFHTNPTPVELNRAKTARLAEGYRLYELLSGLDRKFESAINGDPALGLLSAEDRRDFRDGLLPGHIVVERINGAVQSNPMFQEAMAHMLRPPSGFKLKNPRRNPSEYWKGNLQKSVKEGLNRRDYLFGDTSSALNDRDLSGANLEGADLALLNLSGANLRGAHLSYAHMEQVDLEGADLVNAELLGAKLQDSRLNGANMTNAHMDNVTLTRANLINANLSGASLLGADLTYANLTGANLTGAQMRGANLKGAIMDGATLPDGTRHQ